MSFVKHETKDTGKRNRTQMKNESTRFGSIYTKTEIRNESRL